MRTYAIVFSLNSLMSTNLCFEYRFGDLTVFQLVISIVARYLIFFRLPFFHRSNDARCFLILINLKINFNSFQIKYLTQKNIYINQFRQSFFFSRHFFHPFILSFIETNANNRSIFFSFISFVIHSRCGGCVCVSANRALFACLVATHINLMIIMRTKYHHHFSCRQTRS